MIELWETQCKAYSKVLDAHPKREAFDHATTMEEKLAVDADLFLDIYFLDRKTTPDPISLSAFDWDTVKTAVDNVDTLNARVIGSGKKKVLRIGWYENPAPPEQFQIPNPFSEMCLLPHMLNSRVAVQEPPGCHNRQSSLSTKTDG